jgi:hypothetical protein
MPFDNAANFVTSMAVINPNPDQEANVTARFRDLESNLVGSEVRMTLPPRGHRAFSLVDLEPSLRGIKGIAEWSSSNPVVIGLGLRFDPQELFTSYSTLPSDDLGAPVVRKMFAHIAARSSWKSTITLVNTGPVAANYTLRFRAQDGGPLGLNFENRGLVQQITGSIPAGGSSILSTADAPDEELAQGWVEVESTAPLEGILVFRQRVPGRPDREAAVTLESGTTGAIVMPFDNRSGFVTSVALVNPSDQPAMVTIAFRGEAGISLGPNVVLPTPIPPRGHVAFPLASDLLQAFSGQSGVVEFSTQGGSLVGLGLRFDPAGLFTSFPSIAK